MKIRSTEKGKVFILWGGWFRGTPFRSLLQGGLKGLRARGGGDEGLKVEGGFTFGRLQGASRGSNVFAQITGGVHTPSCLQHSNGARGPSGD